MGGEGLGATKIRFPSHLGIAGTVYTSGETVNIPYAYADLRFNPAFDKKTGVLVWSSSPGDRPKDNSFSLPILGWLGGKRQPARQQQRGRSGKSKAQGHVRSPRKGSRPIAHA